MEELNCPICGAPTRVYMGNARKDRLCAKHADELKKGNIIINEEGLVVDVKSNKVLNKDYEEFKKEEQDSNGIVRCIICGRETKPGFFFCTLCYTKYKNKELLVKITNCKDVDVLDDLYEGLYICDDGHIVKSKSERDIDNYLFENNIPHAYERVFIPKSNVDETIKPDFTLPNYNNSGKDVFIEHWGFASSNIKYTKSKNYKIKIYRDEKITLISTNEKDMQDYKTSLKKKLSTFEYDKINFD